MRSNNPVFQRAEGFNGQRTYSDPSTWSTGAPAYGDQYGVPTHAEPGTRMTLDSVVQRTGAALGLLVLAAAATWVLTGPVPDSAPSLMMLWMFGAFAGLGLSLVISFKKVISPALVMVFSVVEGVFVGAMSKYFEAMWPGIVMSAVLGTFAAAAGTLAAYKFFNISVGDKFRRGVVAAMFGFVGLILLDFVLGFFGVAVGFSGFGFLGLAMSVLGLVLGVLSLILDFDFVERGVAAGLPEVESWRAAFGLTVSVVWIYINLLRILAILRGQE